MKQSDPTLRPYTAAELDQMMMQSRQAMREAPEGTLHMVNCNGSVGDEALRIIQANVDGGSLVAWQGTDSSGATGNCFFATTDLMMQLTDKGQSDRWRLVTGVFTHFDIGEPIYHCWLEYKNRDGAVAVNCSNLDQRPLYAMERGQYLEVNACSERIQVISADEFRKRLKAMRSRLKDENPDELPRQLTKSIFKKTFFRLNRTHA